jgi:hypothetical protein
MMIRVFKTNGEVDEVVTKPTLKWYQNQVGGYIQMVILKDGSQLICDEEGKLKGYPVNQKATFELWFPNFGATDELVGDVIHLTGDDLLD